MRVRLLLAGLLLVSPMLAQNPAPAAAPKPAPGDIASHPDWPKAKASDVDSVDHILAALYDVISGPAGQKRDWARMRTLFVPDARLIPTRVTAGASDVTLLSIDEYIARASATMEAAGFFEHATHNQVDQFGEIVQVFSTYESRHAAEDAKPFARGINSIQLVKDGGRYWIVNIFWVAERPDNPLPGKYQ
jgi:hypothetical protein